MGVKDLVRDRVPVTARRRLRRAQASVRRQVRRPFKQPTLRRALADIAATAPRRPTDAQLQRLVDGWDNPAAGDLDYLRVVMELGAAADGPVLECGSGLTTLLLSAYASQPVWTLEADERWHRRVRAELDAAGLTGATVVHAPLEDHGEFHWYRLPSGLPAAFSLVVCDGPAAAGLPGGRIGLMPVLGSRIRPGSPVVVDRGMVHEGEVVAAWESDYGLTAEDRTTAYRVYRTPVSPAAAGDAT